MNLNKEQLKNVYISMSLAIDVALKKVRTQGEPQIVANLVFHLSTKINALNLTSVKVGGVFIHAKPFVTCNSFPAPPPNSVEIGDLLLIRNGKRSGKIVEQRALLLQAKKVKEIPTKPDNPNQYHLYSQWGSSFFLVDIES